VNRDRRIPSREFKKDIRAPDSEGWELWLNITVQAQGALPLNAPRLRVDVMENTKIAWPLWHWVCDKPARQDTFLLTTRSYLGAPLLRWLNRINIRWPLDSVLLIRIS
jgi:hypothetical protein